MIQEYKVVLSGQVGPWITIYVNAALGSEAERIAEAQYPGYQVVVCHPSGKPVK